MFLTKDDFLPAEFRDGVTAYIVPHGYYELVSSIIPFPRKVLWMHNVIIDIILGYIGMLHARIFRSLIIRTGIKERNIRARNITI